MSPDLLELLCSNVEPRSAARDHCTVKLSELVAVPEGVVTDIVPVTAPPGTVAVICVSESTENVVAATPPNPTPVAPVNPVPVMVTDAPIEPDVGVKEDMVGAAVPTVNAEGLVAVPAGLVTVILPVTAPDGTVAVI